MSTVSKTGRAYNLDFVLSEGSSLMPKVVFRFYPCRSHMHGFDEENPPKSYDDVYKVYYSWSILERHVGDNGVAYGNSVRVFEMNWDECSALTDLDKAVSDLLDNKRLEYTVLSLGQPGSIWEVRRLESADWLGDEWVFDPENDKIQFSVWNNITNLGYRFVLTLDKASNFVEYLNSINLYMLEHSEPI